jgi:hypothetical protein
MICPPFPHGSTTPRGPVSSLYEFHDHTQLHTPLEQWSACCRHLSMTTHNIHTKQTSIPPGSIPTHNSKKQAAAGPCLRSCGHWGRHGMIVQKHVQETNHSPIWDPILGICLKNQWKMTPSIRTVGINKVWNCLIKTKQDHYLLNWNYA